MFSASERECRSEFQLSVFGSEWRLKTPVIMFLHILLTQVPRMSWPSWDTLRELSCLDPSNSRAILKSLKLSTLSWPLTREPLLLGFLTISTDYAATRPGITPRSSSFHFWLPTMTWTMLRLSRGLFLGETESSRWVRISRL